MHALHSITRERLTGHECKQIMSNLISPSVLNPIFIVVFHYVIPILDMIIRLFFYKIPEDVSLINAGIVKIKRNE
jgi:hypothetical protein